MICSHTLPEYKWILIGVFMSADYYGYVAAFLTTIAFLPQVLRIYRTRSSDDVSIIMLIFFITGLLFWVVYGFLSSSLPVLVANLITLLFNLVILVMKFIYK